jgi:uncharacterized protein (DUF362 family)
MRCACRWAISGQPDPCPDCLLLKSYDRVLAEYRRANVRFIDFNEEEKYVVQEIVDRNHHLMQVRLAARLFDPDAFILGAALLKAHDNVVATLSVKNLVMAAPLHSTRKDTAAWHDKSKFHQGYREIQMNLAITARRMRPFWGATVIDGFEGMSQDAVACHRCGFGFLTRLFARR